MQMTPVKTDNAEAVETVIRVPVTAKLQIAPENVRPEAKKGDVAGMADSIASPVGLIAPLVGYHEDGKYFVTAGGRRLRALNLLKREKRLPVDIKVNGAPFLLKPKADAIAISTAENVQREPMTDAEALRAYKRLADDGLNNPAIAAVCGTGEGDVARLLKLANVAPEIFDAFDAGKIDLDVLKAFTISDDHARQKEVFTDLSEQGYVYAQYVRRALSGDSISGSDRLAVFVGEAAYFEAGGTVITDLFRDSETAIWSNRALVERLATAKMEQLQDDVLKEGWADVQTRWDDSYGFEGRLEHQWREQREMSDEEGAAYEALKARAADADLSIYEAAQAAHEADEFRQRFIDWSDDEKAAGTAFIVVSYRGVAQIKRGYFPPVASSGVVGGSAKTPPPFGHSGHERMTRIATTAVRNAVALDAAAAYDALVVHQAWMTLRNRADHGFALPFAKASDPSPEGITIRGDRDYEDLYAAWDERVPRRFLDMMPFVVSLSAEDKASLLALCVATQLNAVETRADYRRERAWAELGMIGGRAGVQINECWTPDEGFLKGAGKKALLSALEQMEQDPDTFAKEKKTALVEIVTRHATKAKWVPSMLASFTEPTLSDHHNNADGYRAAAVADDDSQDDADDVSDQDD